MTQEDEPSRSEGAQYATGEEWRAITKGKKEFQKEWRARSKQKQYPAVDVFGGESPML